MFTRFGMGGSQFRSTPSNASVAVKSSRRSESAPLDFVQAHVSNVRVLDVSEGQMLSIRSACNAARDSHQRELIPVSVRSHVCTVPVERVSVIKVPRQPVYDIEVDGLPEFFANGILVHNSSVSRIPLVKLTGISPSGLNATAEPEIRCYYDTISAYQNRFFRPHLTRVINFAQLSLWGEIDPELTFNFEPLWESSEKEVADLQKAEAERDQVYVDMGAFSPEEIRKIKIDNPKLPYTNLNPEELPSLRSEEEAGLEPVGGRPDPLAEQGPELGEQPAQGEGKTK